jgi:hypothetical protein
MRLKLFAVSALTVGLASAATIPITLLDGVGSGEVFAHLTGGNMGTTVNGTALGLQTSIVSTTETLLTFSQGNGVSGIENATSGALLTAPITIMLPLGFTFTDITFNARCQPGDGGGTPCESSGNTLSLSGTLTSGDTGIGSTTFTNGENRYTIFAPAGTAFTSFSISSTSGFTDLRQVGFSGLAGPEDSSVPEPGTIGLVLLGLGAAALRLQRTKV